MAANSASSTRAQASSATDPASVRLLANTLRALSMDAVEAAKSGHPGMPMGMADVATVLFSQFLKFDASSPAWPDRDRFVLSAGHGSMLLYSLLYLTGYDDMTLDAIKRFRQLGSPAAGHPEYGHAAGIETTTGPLGQGISNAVGMALAERLLNARFGDALVNHKTYVIASDGDLMEGISQESCALAGHLKLNQLIVLFDDNGISIDGAVSLSDTTDQIKRFESMGWNAVRVDGHDTNAIAAALKDAQTSDKPTMIACKSIIGYGAPKRAGTSKSHGEALGAEEIAGARLSLSWAHEPFHIPPDILTSWREIGARGAAQRKEWEARLNKTESAARNDFETAMSGEIPASFTQVMRDYRAKLVTDKPNVATRKASEMALEIINAVLPTTIGGSADLTGSNLTRTKDMKAVAPGDYAGRFIHYGIREHGMASAMNGMALHGGIIPYSGTFLVFADYCRPALRLAALMGKRVIHVMTHDSIGLGEDGPTHQPVETLTSLRLIPNLVVMRPADAVETAECWEVALTQKTRPSVLALSRQNLPTLRTDAETNKSARGAYVLMQAPHEAKVTIIATGSEVEIAVKARELLQTHGLSTRVISMPSWELFDEQDELYRRSVLDGRGLTVVIEAGLRTGWGKYTGPNAIFIGMDGFGASAPAKDLYKHFGITAEAAVEKVLARLEETESRRK